MMRYGNLSRAEVYDSIFRHHLELSRVPTPPGPLDPPPPRLPASGGMSWPKPGPGADRQTHGAVELRLLLERLLVAFHPNSIPLLPCAEWILSHYPPNPAFFRSLETLREDTRNSDVDRVSRVIAQDSAQIDRLREAFSEMMTEILEENDGARKSAIICNIERLGVEWGASEARIQTVTVWFKDRWGMFWVSS